MQRFVRCVTGQIEDEIHHLAPREHSSTTGLSAEVRHFGDGGIDFRPLKKRQLMIGVAKCHMGTLASIHGLFYALYWTQPFVRQSSTDAVPGRHTYPQVSPIPRERPPTESDGF